MSDDDTCTTRDCSDCKRKNVPIEDSNRKFNYKTLYNSYKSNDPEFNLTLDEFVEMATSKCTYCGHRDFTKGYNGVDRVDSSMAHIQGNCVSACWTCNRMKSDMDVHEWIRHIARIVEYCKKNNHFQ